MKKHRFIPAILFIVAVGIGIFLSCQKENLISNNSMDNKIIAKQKKMGGGGDEGNKYYQWRSASIYDEQMKRCYLANVCEGPFETPISPSCSNQREIVYAHDTLGKRVEVNCNSTFYPFPSTPYNGMTWNVEISKEFIAENYWMFQDAYSRGMIDETPEGLYNNAPSRTDTGFSYQPNIIDLVPPINVEE